MILCCSTGYYISHDLRQSRVYPLQYSCILRTLSTNILAMAAIHLVYLVFWLRLAYSASMIATLIDFISRPRSKFNTSSNAGWRSASQTPFNKRQLLNYDLIIPSWWVHRNAHTPRALGSAKAWGFLPPYCPAAGLRVAAGPVNPTLSQLILLCALLAWLINRDFCHCLGIFSPSPPKNIDYLQISRHQFMNRDQSSK